MNAAFMSTDAPAASQPDYWRHVLECKVDVVTRAGGICWTRRTRVAR